MRCTVGADLRRRSRSPAATRDVLPVGRSGAHGGRIGLLSPSPRAARTAFSLSPRRRRSRTRSRGSTPPTRRGGCVGTIRLSVSSGPWVELINERDASYPDLVPRAGRRPDDDDTHDVGAGERMLELAETLFPICRSITGDGVRATLARGRTADPTRRHTRYRAVPQVLDWIGAGRVEHPRRLHRDDRAENASSTSRRRTSTSSATASPCGTNHARTSCVRTCTRTPPSSRTGSRTARRTTTAPGASASRSASLDALDERAYERRHRQHARARLTHIRRSASLPGEIGGRGAALHSRLPSVACKRQPLRHRACSPSSRPRSRRRPRRLTYRLLFIPGTIGSITWLARNEDAVARRRGGPRVACVGDPAPLTYKRSRRGDGTRRRGRRARRRARRRRPRQRLRPVGMGRAAVQLAGLRSSGRRLTRSAEGAVPRVPLVGGRPRAHRRASARGRARRGARDPRRPRARPDVREPRAAGRASARSSRSLPRGRGRRSGRRSARDALGAQPVGRNAVPSRRRGALGSSIRRSSIASVAASKTRAYSIRRGWSLP